MRAKWVTLGLCGGLVALAYACGGTEEGLFSDAGTGIDAAVDGTVDLDGATDGGLPDASPPVDSGPPCAPPKDPSKASMCLYFAPESIAFDSNDPAFDGKGVIIVEVLATPSADAGVVPAIVLPPQSDAGVAQLDLSQPIAPAVIDDLPATVYVRASFIDDLATASGGLRAGWWLGGYDFTNGTGNPPIKSVALAIGKGTNHTLDLVALRRLLVTVSRAALVAPTGNGQGPVSTLAINSDTINTQTRGFGSAQRRCGDVSGVSSALLSGVVIGKGPYYLTGTLDDYGVGGGLLPSGGMISVDSITDAGLKLPAANRVTYAPNAYSISHTINLNFALPRGDAGPVDNVNCP